MDVFEDICKIFDNNEDFKEKMKELKSKLPMQRIEYKFLDCLFKKTYDQLQVLYKINKDSLHAWGYVLFWLAHRNFYLKENDVVDIEWNADIDASLNFALGVTKQKWFNVRRCIAEKILQQVFIANGIIYYEVGETEIFALLDVLQDKGEFNETPHKRVMRVVNISQRLFPEKDRYNVKIIGYSFMGDMPIPDIHKNISKDKLPYVWITQLNGCFLKLQEYERLPDNWQITYDLIVNARNAVIEYFNSMATNIEIAYRKGNFKVFSSIDYQNKKERARVLSSKNPYINPKCAVDRYGMKTNNYVVQNNEDKYSSERNVEDDRKHISHLCHEYFSQIQAFCNSGECILLDAINRKEKGTEARIAYYNLIQALIHLDVLQHKFDEHFREFGEFSKKEEEKDILERLVSMLTIVYKNNFAVEKSISYKARLSVRVTEKKIEEFLSKGIKSLPGVQRIYGTMSNPIVEISVFEYEEFLKQFFERIKGLAGEMDSVSFAGYLLLKYFKQLQIHIICEGDNKFPSANINARDVLLYNDYDKFINMILPTEEVKDAALINVTQAGVVGIGVIALMKKLFSYAVEIEGELKEKKSQNVVKEVYDNYQNKLYGYIKEASESFKEACKYIAVNAIENITEVQDTKDILCECTEQIEKEFFELVKENELEEIIQVLDGFMEKFCQYVDISGAMRDI